MGSIGGNEREERSSACGLFTTEEAEFMAQLLGFSLTDKKEMGEDLKLEGAPTSFWTVHQSEFCVVDDATNTTSTSLNINDDDCFSQGTGDDDNVRPKAQEKSIETPQLPKKRSRNLGNVQKENRSERPKKSQKGALRGKEGEEHNAGCNEQRRGSWSSEDDFNGPQKLNVVVESDFGSNELRVVNSNGKTKAGKGAATDPQSIYARKRRERINERLRILQNLVPNGTKVDISTMLEEAVQYVKLLQLQIKLLSSDDLWMSAPLAYNGMNTGLDLELAPPKTKDNIVEQIEEFMEQTSFHLNVHYNKDKGLLMSSSFLGP